VNKKTVLILAGLAVVLLGGAAFVTSNYLAERQAAEAEERRQAEQKLQAIQEQRQWAEQKEDESRQWAELQSQQKAEQQENALNYPPARLEKAAKVRNWASVKTGDLGVEAWFKSYWRDNHMHFRVALLGQHAALEYFVNGYKGFHVMLADPNGVNIFETPVRGDEFHWAPASANQGIPTLELEKDVDIPLDTYERAVQWNFQWDQ
jgi:hypothetical protein